MPVPKPRPTTLAVLTCFLACMAPPLLGTPQDPRGHVAAEGTRTSPEWLRDAVVYEIFPRTFSAEGTLRGVTRRLDDLRELGVSVLWLMPIHPIGAVKARGTWGNPYAVRDHFAVNPDYGTPADLRRLVTEAHRRGMRVVLDMVVNRTAWDSVLMRESTLYTQRDGRIVPPGDAWPDVAGLDFGNPRTRALMLDVFRFWIEEYDVDGYRCDAAAMVPAEFWARARATVSALKPDAVLIAGGPDPQPPVAAFDLAEDSRFHDALAEVLRGRRPATMLAETWASERARAPHGPQRLNFSDNHDQLRAIARVGEGGALAASAIVFALDGVPMLYNGMEVGDTTESAPPALFERLPVFWQAGEQRPHVLRFYRQWIALRRTSPALASGDLDWATTSGPERVVAIRRRAADEEVVVIVNTSNQPWTGGVTVPGAAPWSDVTPSVDPPQPGAPPPHQIASLATLALPAWGTRVVRRVPARN